MDFHDFHCVLNGFPLETQIASVVQKAPIISFNSKYRKEN